MISFVLYVAAICFFLFCFLKMKHHKSEWVLLLVILSYIKTCLTFLFSGTTVFTMFQVGNTEFHLDDIILIVFLLYIIWEIFRRKPNRNSLFVWILLLLPITWSLFRGGFNNTFGSATFYANIRKYVLFIVAAVAVNISSEKSICDGRMMIWMKYVHRLMDALVLYVATIWVLDLIFGIKSLPGQYAGTLSDGGSTMRIISAPQALIIALYSLYLLYGDLDNKGKISLRFISFALVTFLLQWRTVVAAFCVGLVILVVIFAIVKKSVSKIFIIQLLLLFTIGFVLFSSLSDVGLIKAIADFVDSFSNVNNNTGTYFTRVQVWATLLGSLSGTNLILGLPFGSSYANGIEWEYSAHSGYVDYIMIAGILGLVLFLICIIGLLLLAFRKKALLAVAVISVLLVYWYGYGFSIEQGALLGILIAYLNKSDIKSINCHQ